MHTKVMEESEGVFIKTDEMKYVCQKCKQLTVTCKTWKSYCGGYEDYKYICENKKCKYFWWVDGIDS